MATLKHGRDSMIYEFDNGTIEAIKATTPNGTNMSRFFFKEFTDAQKLFDEIKDWATRIDCETTILLRRNSEPYVVITPKLEEVK